MFYRFADFVLTYNVVIFVTFILNFITSKNTFVKNIIFVMKKI